MLDLFPENNKVYNLFISYPTNDENYETFIRRLSSANEAFKWEDVTDISDSFAQAIDRADAVIILSGLWNKNKELLKEHLHYADTFNKPVIIIRPYGAEEIPEELNEYATKVIGWNTACIVDAILYSIGEEDTCDLY